MPRRTPPTIGRGDEPKWQRIFVAGVDVFVDEPALDSSSATYGIQLSVPVWDRARRIGVLTFTLAQAQGMTGGA